MEDLDSVLFYFESVEELKQKLLDRTMELESVKIEAMQQMKKHKEEVKQLIDLLKVAYKERDSAKDQLQKLLPKFLPSSPTELQSPLILPLKTNSDITESNSLSHGSSPPVDSFFDAVTSPELSSISMAANSTQLGFVNNKSINSHLPSVITDPADAVIDKLAKERTLPKKGKLMQAVMEAGPILQTLRVAAPLPRWRYPPPLQASVPPVATNLSKFSVDRSSGLTKPSVLSMHCGHSQLRASPSLSIGDGIQIPATKRQRFQ